MNRGQRTIAALLGAVGVLLALNLVKGEPEAHAQNGPPFNSAEPTVVAGEVQDLGTPFGGPIDDIAVHRVWRLWSDGTVDLSVFFSANFFSCDLEGSGIPPCGPVVVIDPGP